MISNEEQLQKRGFLSLEVDSKLLDISLKEKIELLNSKIATDRTLGARLLRSNNTILVINILIKALKVEEKLYSKIEICNTLASFGELVISPLIKCLEEIGNNQHKKVPLKEFLKDSYPLPRDIVSRTLIRVKGNNVISKLLKELNTKNKRALSEVIDTIGYINFYSEKYNIFEPLKYCFQKNNNEDLIKWKIIRAFSGVDESFIFLNEISAKSNSLRLNKEIERSLRLILKRRN